MSARIRSVDAHEILDSRGHPTLEATILLEDGTRAVSSVPSGASTGRHEAVELRDGDARRYGGKGVLHAIANVRGPIHMHLEGRSALDQADIDRTLIALDGTEDKSSLGANAILAVSQACSRAAALHARHPLHIHLEDAPAHRLPMPMFNVINGGKHADSGLDIQEFMIVPVGAASFAEALRYASETFHELRQLLQHEGYTISVGDEGGFAPMLKGNEQAFEFIVRAIEHARLRPGVDVAIAIDAAASSFGKAGHYRLSRTTYREMGADELTELYADWVGKFPIVSIEDGLAEDDWDGFRRHTARLGDKVQIVGDDMLVTNTRYIERAIREKSCNAALIKPNQIGTVTETVAAIDLCRDAGWGYVISHRSGETADTFIADLAVALGAPYIKAGSVCRGERIAKYNRLVEIERELGSTARFGV